MNQLLKIGASLAAGALVFFAVAEITKTETETEPKPEPKPEPEKQEDEKEIPDSE